MLPPKPLRQADVVASCFFILLGIVVIVAASRMPWSSTRTGGEAQWFLSPGLFPVVVGALLIIFSGRVLAAAIREGGHRDIGRSVSRWLAGLRLNRRMHRLAIMVVLLSVYIFGGVGRINFLLASFLFLFVAFALFWWREAPPGKLGRYVLTSALVAAAIPAVITTLFSNFLYVAMP